MFSSEANIRSMLPTVDAIIGAVLKPGAKAPHLVTRDMLKEMRPGTVLAPDVAIDQGGCFETSKPTTHQDPTYFVDNVLHYCVANMPGCLVQHILLHWDLQMSHCHMQLPFANKGWKQAIMDDPELKMGLNIANGIIVYADVATAFNMKWEDVESVLD